MIPMYQEPKFNPSIPNEHKEIMQERMAERGPPKPAAPPTISFQYNQPHPPPKPKPMDVAPYMPIYSNPYPTQMYNQQMGYPYGYPSQFTLPPVIKNTYINTEGPSGDHERIFHVYEDSLLPKSGISTFSTLGERIHMFQFVRSSIFDGSDGNDISLSGKSENSLLSFIKFAELNPYNTYRFSANVYRGLPDGFLMYRSCYPIRHQETTSSVVCAKDSTAINVRIYKMLEGSYLVNRINPADYYVYDEWREVAFYEYIREYIIKKKVCPHFVLLYGYFISEKANIDFTKISLLRNGPNATSQPAETQYKVTADLVTINKQLVPCDGPQKTIEANPNAYLGKALVLLTESPTYGIFGWASKTYQVRGTVKEMVNRGIHSDKEWTNVIFQIIVALYAMQLNKIFIRNFSLENNVYIKDLTLKGSVTEYWKYKIHGMDFYLPNLGYVVMIDTNYKDVTHNVGMSLGAKTTSPKKLDGKVFETNKMSDADINDQIFEMFKNTVNPNSFDKEFEKYGGCPPVGEVKSLLQDILNESSTDAQKNIGSYISRYMRQYMHNRVGTYLKETEVPNIRRDDTREFTKGQLLVHEDGYGSYKFVIFVETNTTGVAKIFTKRENTDTDIINSEVPVTSLLNYSRAEPIAQTYKPNEANMNEDDLLETYVVQ
jgi:hypothetical protein